MGSTKKRSIPLIISAILGVAYSVYIVAYFSGVLSESNSESSVLAGAIVTTLVTPHMVCVVVAAILNVLASIMNKRALALAGAILYCVSAVVFLMYALFVVPSIVLSFVGYAQLKKRQVAAII